MDNAELDLRLRRLLDDYGIDVTSEQRRLLLRHLLLVIDKNRSVNLTRIIDPASGLVLHVLDSLLLLHQVNEAPKGDFVDIGTGAGFPGVPLGIVSFRKGVLVDSVGKKTQAVSEFIHDLGLDDHLHTWHGRIEDLARNEGNRFAVAVCRAVAQTNTLVEYASPLLIRGGRLVITKGNLAKSELDAGMRAAHICGLEVVSRETYELPEKMGHREILVFEKTGRPRIRLPRKAGLAKREPLGLGE